MTDHRHRHDVWGDDPEERDASAVVEEILAERAGRPWHDHPGIVWVKAVGRFIGRNSRRVGITIAGFAVMLAGVVLLVLPGPGWLLIFAGLAILSTEYVWARRLLMTAKRKAEQAKDAVVKRKNGRAERKARRNGQIASSPSDDIA
ncbi:MAG TPA: PGPGW domain-containing protein [Actinomycetota bacterium]|nr:PGPGW domain-containing protein [Actinomycetota bacterium]